MNLLFDSKFYKKIDKVPSEIRLKLISVIELCEGSSNLSEIKNCKKIVGYKNYYRIKIGDYRIGVELVDSDTLLFVLILPRKEIYKFFP
jgi:mRNA interferase RelE/StbE